MKTTVELLSEKFSEIVNREFSPEQLKDVIEKNRTDEYIGCCATHDHCDANMLMDEAYTEIVGHEIDLQNQDETQLWSNAWDLSKGNNFSI